MITSLDYKNAFCKIQYLFLIKFLERLEILQTNVNMIKVAYSKSKANIKLNGEKSKPFH